MPERIAFLSDNPRVPEPATFLPLQRPLELVVPYTNAALTVRALAAAAELAQGFAAAITLIAVHVLPYPAPLECQGGIRASLEAELTALARTSPVAVRVELVFARDREEAYLDVLRRKPLIVIGARDRWWRTREERLARRLAGKGHSVAVLKVR